MGSIKLDGNTLSSTEVALVSMGEKVEVASDAWIRVDASRKVVENILVSGETVYGINTGFGALVSKSISSDDLAALQVNLIRSHACAIGEKMTIADIAMWRLLGWLTSGIIHESPPMMRLYLLVSKALNHS